MNLQQRVAQINYDRTPLFQGRAGEIVHEFLDKFKETRSTDVEWAFRNEDKHWLGSVALDRASLSWEASTDRAGFLTNAIQLFERVESTFELQAPFRRVGYRVIALQETESFEKARDMILSSLMRPHMGDWSPLNVGPDDLHITLEWGGTKQEPGRRIIVAPVRKEEPSIRSGMLAFPDAVEVENAILLDIDAWHVNQDEFKRPLRELSRQVEELCADIDEKWFAGGSASNGT